MSQLSHLDELEAEAIHIQRSCGRVRKACYALLNRQGQLGYAPPCNEGVYPEKPPFPFLHIDTTWKFKDMIKFRDDTAKKLGIEMLVSPMKKVLKKVSTRLITVRLTQIL